MLFKLALRYGALLIGLSFVAMSVKSWKAGSPPAWTMLAPRVTTVVHSAFIESGRIQNGSSRHFVRVNVVWPKGSNQLKELGSVHPTFYGFHIDEAEEILQGYKKGSLISVRVVSGSPHANKNDVFSVAHAVFSGLFGVFLTGLGLLSFFVFGPQVNGKK